MEAFDLRKWSGFAEAGGDISTQAMIDQITIDSRRVYSPNSLFVALQGSRVDGHLFLSQAGNVGAKYALVNQKCDISNQKLKLLKVKDPLLAFQEIAGTYRNQFQCQVIGITGSYGKTMVKDLLQELLSTCDQTMASPESFNSQIGVPLSLLKISKNDVFAIIEAGISKIGEMEKLRKIISPEHVILTHIGKKHQDGLGSLPTTASEMMVLMEEQTNEGWSLMPSTQYISTENLKSKPYFWNLHSKNLPHAQRIQTNIKHLHQYEIEFPKGKKFEGLISSGHYYFLDLINIAVKAAWLLGCTLEGIKEVLNRYSPEPMRTEMWQNPLGGTIINEPYCSDPQSVDIALRHFEKAHPDGKKFFIFGGIRDCENLKDFDRIGGAIAKANIDALYLIGNQNFSAPNLNIVPCKTYDDAFEKVKSQIKPNDTLVIKGERKKPLDWITKKFQGSISTNQCFINLAAIGTNLCIIRKKAGPKTRIMPIIKASAYGTDNLMMTKFLESQGIDIFGVSYVDEGIALRKAGIKKSLFTINAAAYEAKKAVDSNLEIGVSDTSLIKALADEAECQKKVIKVHLHVDTGMSRLGCRKEEALALAKDIASIPFLKLEGIMTHFAAAESPKEDPFTLMQIKQFDHVISSIEKHGISIPWKHAANSSALMRFELPQYNMARVGLALYGLTPSPAAKESLELKLALSLQSRIVGINLCKKGETVSYGRNYTIEKDHQKIAVVPIGYFDGMHRHYSGKCKVIIHGQTAQMVGNICMDYLMVDISDIPYASIGDPVLIFGEDEHGNYLSPEDLAVQGNSIAHELITCLGPRIQRVFIHEETSQVF
jgi:alanine racemase/UDP-N-acetylmuramoyl-tripeptide--D-alanyl-D-alanine ligase